MSGPIVMAVEDDVGSLGDVERELRDRYARSYSVVCMRSPHDALTMLERLAASEEEVALVLAGESLGGMSGSELLGRAGRLHAHAQRGLLIDWGSWGEGATAQEIFEAMARGQIDYYVIRPSTAPDELFHQAISTFLLEWAHARRVSPHTVHVVGASWSGRAYELREALGRCAIPHAFCLADSPEGRAFVAQAGAQAPLPLVVFPNGAVLADPSNVDLAAAAGAPVDLRRWDFDLVIVGAGPAGLSSAVYGASEGLRTLVIDEGGIGGQATFSSLIRNYLGFPRGIGGRRLAEHAYEQAWVLGAKFAFMQRATDIRRDGDGLVVTLADMGEVGARSVVLATGARYRTLGITALEELNGAGVYYGGPASEAPAMAGRDAYIVGGANSAGQAAVHLADYARRVTLVVRAPSLDAGMSHYLVRRVEALPNVEVRLGTEVVDGGGAGWLEHIVLRRRSGGADERVRADGLFLMIGAEPNADWLPPELARDDRGFIRTGADVPDDAPWPRERSRFPLETSLPGVFAVGDVRHGSVNRVASAVGEGSIAVRLIHRLFDADGLHPLGRA